MVTPAVGFSDGEIAALCVVVALAVVFLAWLADDLPVTFDEDEDEAP